MIKYSREYKVNSFVSGYYLMPRTYKDTFVFKMRITALFSSIVLLLVIGQLGFQMWASWFGNLGKNSILGVVLLSFIFSNWASVHKLLTLRFSGLKTLNKFYAYLPILLILLILPWFGSMTFYLIYAVWVLLKLMDFIIYSSVKKNYKNKYPVFLEKVDKWWKLKLLWNLVMLAITFDQGIFLQVCTGIFGMVSSLGLPGMIILIPIFSLILITLSSGFIISIAINYKHLAIPGVKVDNQPMPYFGLMRLSASYTTLLIGLLRNFHFNIVHAIIFISGIIAIALQYITIKRMFKNKVSTTVITMTNMGYVILVSGMVLTSVMVSYISGTTLLTAFNTIPLIPTFAIWGYSNLKTTRSSGWITAILSFATFLVYGLVTTFSIVINSTAKSGGDLVESLSVSEMAVRLVMSVAGAGIFIVAFYAIWLSISTAIYVSRLKRVGEL